MRCVVIESPYAGDVERNLRYLRACLADSLARDEAPFASHAIYTQLGVLRDELADERQKGIGAGYWWRTKASATVVYLDLGVSAGMLEGIRSATTLRKEGHTVELRRLGGEWSKVPLSATDAALVRFTETLFGDDEE